MKICLAPRRRPGALVWLCATFVAGGVSGLAHAQSAATSAPSVMLDRFSPGEAGSGWFALDVLDFRGHGRFVASVVTDEAYRPLVVRTASDDISQNVVTNQLATHLQGAVTLADRYRLALSLPLFLVETGNAVDVNGVAYPAPSSGVGDPRLGADARLYRDGAGRIVAAAGVQAELPLGIGGKRYGRESGVRLLPHVAAAGHYGRWAYAARVGVLAHVPRDFSTELPLGTSVQVGAAGGARLWRERLLIGPEIYGSTMVDGDGPFKTRSTPLEALLGAHYASERGFGAGVGVGAGLVQATGTPPFRFVATVNYTPGMNRP